MSRVRRAITACFFHFFFFLKRECMPVESPFPIPFPQILGVCVCGRVGSRVDVQARVVYVSE